MEALRLARPPLIVSNNIRISKLIKLYVDLLMMDLLEKLLAVAC